MTSTVFSERVITKPQLLPVLLLCLLTVGCGAGQEDTDNGSQPSESPTPAAINDLAESRTAALKKEQEVIEGARAKAIEYGSELSEEERQSRRPTNSSLFKDKRD